MAYSGIQNWLSEELKTIQESGLWKNEKLIKTLSDEMNMSVKKIINRINFPLDI